MSNIPREESVRAAAAGSLGPTPSTSNSISPEGRLDGDIPDVSAPSTHHEVKKEISESMKESATERNTSTLANASSQISPLERRPTSMRDMAVPLTWIEDKIFRHPYWFGFVSTTAILAAAALTLVAIFWLCTYDQVFHVVARTEVLSTTVSAGPPLTWNVKGATLQCDHKDAKERMAVGDVDLTIPTGFRVTILSLSVVDAENQKRSIWELRFVPPDKNRAGNTLANPVIRARSVAGDHSHYVDTNWSICLAPAEAFQSMRFPLRGEIVIGKLDELDDRARMLLDGDLSLIESPWLGRWQAIADYRIDQQKVLLHLGDAVRLASYDACKEPLTNCVETQGFVRLEGPDKEGRPLMSVRASSASREVKIVRPNRQTQNVHSSLGARIAGDHLLVIVSGLAAFLYGVGVFFLESLQSLRSLGKEHP